MIGWVTPSYEYFNLRAGSHIFWVQRNKILPVCFFVLLVFSVSFPSLRLCLQYRWAPTTTAINKSPKAGPVTTWKHQGRLDTRSTWSATAPPKKSRSRLLTWSRCQTQCNQSHCAWHVSEFSELEGHQRRWDRHLGEPFCFSLVTCWSVLNILKWCSPVPFPWCTSASVFHSVSVSRPFKHLGPRPASCAHLYQTKTHEKS